MEKQCTCEWADYGGPEDGPSPEIVDCDEQCPIHGREADPEGWAYMDGAERMHEAMVAKWLAEDGHLSYGDR